MKKLLSFILVFTLMLSALSVVPAFANEAEEVQVGDAKMSFATFVTNYASYAAAEVTLLANVDAAVLTAPLAAFSGTFNGNGKAINNLSVPLFASLNGATVQNLTLNGSIGTAEARYTVGTAMGVVANTSEGTVNLTNVVVNADLYASISAATGVGGFIGSQASGTVTAVQCAHNGVVDVIGNKQGNIGGYVGQIMKANCEFNATACQNNGNVFANLPAQWANIGGFVGRADNKVINITLKKCVNNGDVGAVDSTDTQTQFRAGGFGGSIRTGYTGVVTIQNCVNYGDVRGYNGNGATGGYLSENQGVLTISNSYQYGVVDSSALNTGSLVGHMTTSKKLNDFTATFTNCVVVSEGSKLSLMGQMTYGKLVVNNTVLIGAPEEATDELLTANTLVRGIAGVVYVLGKNSTVAQVSGDDTLKVYANKAAWEAASVEIDVIGYQATAVDTATNTFKVRIVTTVTTLEHDAVGFEIIRYDENGAGAVTKVTTKAFTSLLGNDGTVYTPEAVKDGAEYFVPFVIEGVPADGSVTFHVRPYVVEGENVTYGDTMVANFAPEAN